ncbi:shikimate dehydrogenase family protein [Flaviaesturariibacter aridisoli]|uniref:Shikimate dehydrogenase n=1 Tax=Flaviaesturariibacter aridisoli TaxID=2545761 RepID=A0A4R4E6J5_9BACT|nr:shikimate dehydrogenase [Flaviaesturariibacter aridisoli]TCZ74523.1 shikimate dehydrogenase [Flaviaesturariibacter aridisoli]
MRRFGLIGRTLKHSFSKGYFTDKFLREERTDCVYELFELDAIGAFPLLLERHPDLAGLNVTIPYKKEILPFLDLLHPDVQAIGAANTIRFRNGKLEGFNTDWTGFRDALLPMLNGRLPKALVLGTGGAAAAVRYALSQMGIECRSVSRSGTSEIFSYDDLNADRLGEFHLIVNTTPLGTWPDVESLPPIPYEALTAQHLLFDLVYNPEVTAFLRKGQERGAQIRNGYDMLVFQAEASWKIWNG